MSVGKDGLVLGVDGERVEKVDHQDGMNKKE